MWLCLSSACGCAYPVRVVVPIQCVWLCLALALQMCQSALNDAYVTRVTILGDITVTAASHIVTHVCTHLQR